MHLYKFSQKQKLAFLALAQQIIDADNVYHIREAGYYPLLLMEMNLPSETKPPSDSQEELLAEFNTRVTRTWLILELIGLAHIDDHFAQAELDLIQTIAHGFNFSNDDVALMTGIVHKQRALFEEVNDFVRREAN